MQQGSACKSEPGSLWSSGTGSLLWDSGSEADIVKAPQRRWSDTESGPCEDTEVTEASNASLSRAQVVSRILERNPSATLAYLSQFEDEALRNYLDHLEAADRPRGPCSRWVRRGDSRAIIGRESEY